MVALKKIYNYFFGDEEVDLSTPKSEKATFKLYIEEVLVGELNVENGVWQFEYSTGFKSQDKYSTLPDFPNIDTKYRSPMLWPFFVSRIPGLGQPYIQKIINEKNIDKTNLVQLLKVFGHLSITSPYRLSVTSNIL